MKQSKILNRPMFNAQNSAYGRGITSNLVSEEQRVRYNSGGRVRLAEGSGYEFGETPLGKAGKTFLHRGLYDPLVAGFDMFGAVPLNTAARMFGYNPGFSGTKAMDIGTGGEYSKYGNLDPDVAYFPPFLKTSAKEGWAHKLKAEAEKEKPDDDVIDLKVTEKEKVDPISDTLDWTDQEKKEKMGQIQLKLAQRLVGGARDKWGSKAQMKNIGDAFGDIAAIGDKTALRKDDRKYKAMAKAYKAIDRDKLASAKEYGNQIAGGATESQALKVSTNGKLRSTQLPRNKKQRDKVVDTLVAGDIYFDEGASTNHFFVAGHEDKDGKGIPVPKEKLEEIQDIVIKRVG